MNILSTISGGLSVVDFTSASSKSIKQRAISSGLSSTSEGLAGAKIKFLNIFLAKILSRRSRKYSLASIIPTISFSSVTILLIEGSSLNLLLDVIGS